MDIIEDPNIFRPLAEEAIRVHGHAPEHNLIWFEYYAEANQRPAFVLWPDGTALFTHVVEDEWQIFVEPLSPWTEAGKKIVEFAEHVFAHQGAAEIVIDVKGETKSQIGKLLPDFLTLTPDEYVLTWPIMYMEIFDSKLPGSHFKSIRNSKSKFLRDHKLDVVDLSSVDKKELHRIVDDWAIKRTSGDEAWPDSYHKIININFPGMKSVRVLLVDGKPVGFNAGWEVPNSNPDTYYYGIGLHDYSIRDLGIILYLENLEWIKKAGYKRAEMGGVEDGTQLFFKERFLPVESYKTYSFSIVKNE